MTFSSDWLDIANSLEVMAKCDILRGRENTKSIPRDSNILIWGGGMHLEYLYQKTSFFHDRKEIRFVIVDSDANKHGKTWRGIRIISPDILDEEILENVPIVISSYRNPPN